MPLGLVSEKLLYRDHIPVTETQTNEFKALQITNNLIVAARDFFRDYLNSFANTEGGSLWFGIEDDSEVKGIMLSEEVKVQLEFLFYQVTS